MLLLHGDKNWNNDMDKFGFSMEAKNVFILSYQCKILYNMLIIQSISNYTKIVNAMKNVLST